MAMVRVTATENDTLSEESIARLIALKDRPINYSDIPKSTPEELRKAVRWAQERRRKQQFSLRLPVVAVQWWKSLGDGYTGIMSRLLEEASRHPEWIKQCMEAPPH